MAETQKRYRVVFEGKKSRQHMTVLARNREEAERLAGLSQYRRQDRFPLTFDRLQRAHDSGDLTKDEFKAEMELRKRDMGRYESGELKVTSVKEVK